MYRQEKQIKKNVAIATKTKAMKRIIIITAAFMLTAGLSAFAKKTKPSATVIEKNFYQLSFSKIVVEDDIDIYLSENADKSIEISGDSKYTQQVEWKIKSGVLYIKSSNGSLKDKVKVNISVNQLSILLIKGNSDVKSEGALNSGELKVIVDGEGYIALKNTGTISIEKSDNINLNIHRTAGNVMVK